MAGWSRNRFAPPFPRHLLPILSHDTHSSLSLPTILFLSPFSTTTNKNIIQDADTKPCRILEIGRISRHIQRLGCGGDRIGAGRRPLFFNVRIHETVFKIQR